MRILFVCTGNTCRSPMAEAMFRQMAGGEGVEVLSAGIAAIPDSPASEKAIEVLREKGIPFDHRSRPLDQDLVEWADLILTMTMSHKRYLLSRYEGSKEKIFTLKEFVAEADESDGGRGQDWDIADPFGGSLETYRACAAELEETLRKLKAKLFPEG